jgi:hemin uptake protein HemP
MAERSDDVPDASVLGSKTGTRETAYNAAIGRMREQVGNKVIRFNDLAKCGDEVWIEHAGQLYRLRKTRHEKLVLSK